VNFLLISLLHPQNYTFLFDIVPEGNFFYIFCPCENNEGDFFYFFLCIKNFFTIFVKTRYFYFDQWVYLIDTIVSGLFTTPIA